MNTRKRFIINCLKTIEMLVTLELCREMQIYELAYASNQQTPLPSLQNDMIRLRRLIKTLELFNAIVKNALTLLKEHPALLPGLVPIVMFTTNMLPIDPAINQDMQKKFIRWISQDLFIAKQYKTKIFDASYKAYTQTPSAFFTTPFIKEASQNLNLQLEVFNRMFVETICQNNLSLKQFIAEDANSLRMQISVSVVNPVHAWHAKSYPTSKAELLTQTIAGLPEGESIVKFKFAPVLPWREKQIGQTCKLHAFHAAAWALHLAAPRTTPYPPPIHLLNGMPENTVPLTAQAKHLFASQIGEVYSPQYIMQLANTNKYNNVHMLIPPTEKYISKLTEVIDRNYQALVYFDVNVNLATPQQYGFPDAQEGNYEHSAVVFGHMTTASNRKYFFTYQWENHYKFNANNLARSADQLQRRKGEVFYDIAREGDADWVDLRRANEHQPDILALIKNKQYRNKLFTPPPSKDLPTFRNCIIAMGTNVVPAQIGPDVATRSPQHSSSP